MKPVFKTIRYAAIAVFAVLFFAAFPSEKTLAAGPSLESTKITLVENYEGYTIRFKDIEDNVPLYFSSSDESVATVDETGFVTPVKAGSATILVAAIQGEETFEMKLSVVVREPYYRVIQSNEGCHIGGSVMFEIEQLGYEDETKWSLKGSQYAKLEPMTKTSARLTGLSDGIVTVTLESRDKKTSFKVRIIEGQGEIYAVAPGTKPYGDKYLNSSYYNSHTRDYFMLRSYLERLDEAGGGTLLLKRGVYSVTNILCIPSDTKVVLSDGVLIEKTYETGSGFTANRSIFQTVSFTNFFKYEYSSTYTGLKGYSGTHNVKLLGEGNATIDLKGLDTCAFVIAHAKDVHLKGITMLNMNTNHFVELDAADTVTITNCVFKGSVGAGTSRKQKEAINIDTPDATTGGFTQNWSSFDCTPARNVTISNNIFQNLESAIGTHR
ncbi:MAG: Ig-like domain-containing protein, partial [Lachnospiraceae bacterium]|nr:Ig-like domain-containing protein [Lachnospiraceae bacterium]